MIGPTARSPFFSTGPHQQLNTPQAFVAVTRLPCLPFSLQHDPLCGWRAQGQDLTHPPCPACPAVSNTTRSADGQHKVKISGIVVSQEAGQSEGIRNNAAVEYVHDITSRKDTVEGAIYDVKNHI